MPLFAASRCALASPLASPRRRALDRPRRRARRAVCRVVSSDASNDVDDDDVGTSSTRPLTAVVVGGGIGGLAACVALRRVGVDAHVYERATALRANAGTGIALWPNGVKALRAIGGDVAREVESRGAVIGGVKMGVVDEEKDAAAEDASSSSSSSSSSFKSALGKVAASALGRALPLLMRARHGAGLVCVRWAEAQAALASFLPAHVVHLDASVDAIDVIERADGSESVRVTFARRDGSAYVPGAGEGLTMMTAGDDAATLHAVHADVLVGADGINSAVRAGVLGDGAPRDNGRVIWRGVVDARDVSDLGSDSSYPEFCPRGTTALSASKDSAVGRTTCYMDVSSKDGKLYWAAGCLDAGITEVTPETTTTENTNGRGGYERSRCAATFASYPDVLRCLDATADDALYVSRVLDRPPLFPASSQTEKFAGPVTLLGDAAHPVIPSFGQGANLALEDAVELAVALAPFATVAVDADASSSSSSARNEALKATLRAWETTRLTRTSEAQIASFISGSKSYGEEKLKSAMADAGIDEAALRAHREKFPDANATQEYLISWSPSCGVATTLPELNPKAAMALAMRAASARKCDAEKLSDDVMGRRAACVGVGAAIGAGVFSPSPPPRAAAASVPKPEYETSIVTSTTTYAGDGFRMTLPVGWTTAEQPGVSQSRVALFDASGAKAATIFLEPTASMANKGLASLFADATDFGLKAAGRRNGSLAAARNGSADGVYIAEGTNARGDAPWVEMIAVGCRSGENAKKFNLSQTIRVASEASVGVGVGSAEVLDGLRAVMESFELTAGASCEASR